MGSEKSGPPDYKHARFEMHSSRRDQLTTGPTLPRQAAQGQAAFWIGEVWAKQFRGQAILGPLPAVRRR
jgi:hypothetical protein